MSKHYLLLFCIFMISCNSVHKQDMSLNVIKKDTLINYSINGISAEGTEAKAIYRDKKIYKCIVSIYAETGKAIINYLFGLDSINVSEEKYSYSKSIENVKSKKDIQLDYKINYIIDYNGNIINTPISKRTDIFQELKKTIPFKLK